MTFYEFYSIKATEKDFQICGAKTQKQFHYIILFSFATVQAIGLRLMILHEKNEIEQILKCFLVADMEHITRLCRSVGP